jgi:hypothetical protein
LIPQLSRAAWSEPAAISACSQLSSSTSQPINNNRQFPKSEMSCQASSHAERFHTSPPFGTPLLLPDRAHCHHHNPSESSKPPSCTGLSCSRAPLQA